MMPTSCRRLNLRARVASTLISLVFGATALVSADTQRLELEAGWNLVSLAVEPVDPDPAVVLAPLGANLQALWAYDENTGGWARFPQAVAGMPTITALEPGRGYWLQVASSQNVDLAGVDGALPRGPEELVSGWNLVGFPLLAPAAYDGVFAASAVREVWAFDGTQFQGIVIDSSGLVVREDFVVLEPGRGYWVRSLSAASIGPVLKTTLPGDVDLPPLVDENPPVDDQLPWTSISQGDVDVGQDGFYDRSLTQRAVDFEVRGMQHQLVVANGGAGVLRYRLTINDPDDSCSWLRFQVRNPVDGSTELVTELAGSLATERRFITLAALRADRAPGRYTCDFAMASNGVLPTVGRLVTASRLAVEPVRPYQAHMTVGGLEGDYRLRVAIDTIDGKAADLANPRISLSLYNDADGLKAIIDPQTTLLFSEKVRLAGRLIESETTRFEVNGSFVMQQGTSGNPFAVDVRRDITLRGTRSDRAGLGGPTLLSPDLEGDYFETVRSLTGQPIQLIGTFTGERLGTIASVRDQVGGVDTMAEGLPEVGELTRTIEIADQLLIDEVDVTTNLTHPRPSDLRISLSGPDGNEVLLRAAGDGSALGSQIFDELHTPVESLDLFIGRRAAGTWTLRVQDVVAGESGNLLGWSLDVRGTRVYGVSGSVCSNLPVGSEILLTGCGRTEIVFAGQDRSFGFVDLIPCVYRVQVSEIGFQVAAEDAVLSDSDVALAEFCPATTSTTPPDPIVLPGEGQGRRFSSLTTNGGAGIAPRMSPFVAVEQQYGADSATWDLDRAPVNPASVGFEDTNRFLNIPNPLTKSNQLGTNGTLDGPAGENSFRVIVTLGMPVIGRSVQGDLVLKIGGNPR